MGSELQYAKKVYWNTQQRA